jgi:hypothetical protein
MKKYLAPAALYGLAGFLSLGFFRSDLGLTLPVLVALGLGVVVPIAVATRLLLAPGRETQRRERQTELRQRTIEAEVLRIARHHAGKLTLVEIVSELAVTPAEAKTAADSLVHQQLADIEITDSGVIVYVFPDVRHLGEKESARGLLE